MIDGLLLTLQKSSKDSWNGRRSLHNIITVGFLSWINQLGIHMHAPALEAQTGRQKTDGSTYRYLTRKLHIVLFIFRLEVNVKIAMESISDKQYSK